MRNAERGTRNRPCRCRALTPAPGIEPDQSVPRSAFPVSRVLLGATVLALLVAAYETPAVIVYAEQAVKPDEAPRDWDDLLDPRWKGKILIRDPLASGTMRAVWGMIIERGLRQTHDTAAGFQWLRRLDAQTKEYVLN